MFVRSFRSWRTAAVMAVLAFAASTARAQAARGGFTLRQVKSYPFPTQLTAAPAGTRIAWALDEQGLRNLFVAEGPAFAARPLTHYGRDDGQELTSVSISPDGQYVVYVRGGDHGGNWTGASPNPLSDPKAHKIQIWSVPFAGGTPVLIAEGDRPTISPAGGVIAFERNHEIWTAPIDGSAPARQMFSVDAGASDPTWSPDGSRLAFVSNRGDHALVGVFTNDSTSIRWMAPSTSRDASPVWSPDGTHIAFVRRPGAGGPPDSVLVPHPEPWAIWIADANTGVGHALWTAPHTLRGSPARTQGGANLHWAAGDRIVFLAELDGWPHLYSIPAAGGEPMLLTPGRWMAEYITMSPDRRYLVFCANDGPDANDDDRRHLVKVPVDRAAPDVLTPGAGLEWTPVVTGDGSTIAFISATAKRPPVPAVMPAAGGAPQLVGAERIPADFPAAQLVIPKKVVFVSAGGFRIHGQLFDAGSASGARAGRRPAIVYLHGGPPRQMLLGWHYSDYYANGYALNQYLASRGYIVLSVNYRLGIGYGREFQHPAHAGPQGASEYQDVKAAALYLRSLPQVDPARIGIYGGSYGGFLTAMALSHNSDLFAAGVDISGVHDWTAERARGLLSNDRYEKAPDAARALRIAWASSPVSAIATWKSPVLVIQADDDRNVRFSQMVDLIQRLRLAHVPFEEFVIPDDTHHMLGGHDWVRVDSAAAEFFARKLGGGK
ncbi:MAG TPA: prolyl oligopeptidase family serine peptidase [Gemmatimonadaceae bacterium]